MADCRRREVLRQMNTFYHDPEYIRKQREAHLGSKNPNWKGGVSAGLGKNYIKKGYNYNSAHAGDKHPNWRGGITPFRKQIKKLPEYKDWRIKVFIRDSFTCVNCHKVGCRLNAHHIKSFVQILEENNITTIIEAQLCEELWKVNNGITLCKDCHSITDNYAGKNKRRLRDDR